MRPRFSRTPQEQQAGPLVGYKLAYPMLSADGTVAAFSGVTLGRAHVYRRVDDAICAHGSRHECPSRWCDCGFYCFHEAADARELACAPEHQGAVHLEVAASGRFRRYELGLRYSRQRVRSVRLRACRCGRAATVLADTGSGSAGWRRLDPVCSSCAGHRPVLTTDDFGRLAGGLPVSSDEVGGTVGASEPAAPDDDVPGDAGAVAVLTAEVALLQAQLERMQQRLDELERRRDG